MRIQNSLDLAFFSERLPVILQSESAECGLACLAMVAGFHNYRIDLPSIRSRFTASLKGANLASLMKVASSLNLNSRAVRTEIEGLSKIRKPCILHWSFTHYVVLKKVSSSGLIIHDPAFGVREVTFAEASRTFTGVALEIWPNASFREADETIRIRLSFLFGRVSGLARVLVVVLLLAVVLECFTLITPFFFKWVIDNVIVSSDRDLLNLLALGFGSVFILHQVFTALRSWVVLYIGTSFNLQWRSNILAHLLRLPIQYFEKRFLADIVSRVHSVDHIQRILTTSFLESLLDGLMAFVTLLMMFLANPTLGLAALTGAVIYGVSRLLWYGPLRIASKQEIVSSAKQQNHILETIRGIKPIKTFLKQESRASAWIALLIEQINTRLKVEKLQIFFRFSSGTIISLTYLIVIWLGAIFVLDEQMTVGALVAFIAYKAIFDTRVTSLIDNVVAVKMLGLHGERLSDVLMTDPEVDSDCPIDIELLDSSIEMKNLSYRYADDEPYILSGINLYVNPGESIAIVGPSGCGKSTLLNILTGSIPLREGEILYGGINIKKLGINNFRGCIATVMQDDCLFAGTIAENISFFDSPFDHDRMVECARIAAIHNDIVRMPMRYFSLVGDMGTILSGGQKQRILLARALYKRPKLLILDEATSHLDVLLEKDVNDAIRLLRITRIIVAHRPETIASADRIVKIEKGRLYVAGGSAQADGSEG